MVKNLPEYVLLNSNEISWWIDYERMFNINISEYRRIVTIDTTY
jgi:hypothetical protein